MSRNRFLAEAYSTRCSRIILFVSLWGNYLCRCSTSTARAMRWNIQFQNPACCVFKIREIRQPSCHGQIDVATVSSPRLEQRGSLKSPHPNLSGAMTCAVAALPQREQCDATYNFKILRVASSKSMKSDSQVATDRLMSRNRFLAEASATRCSGITLFVSLRGNDLCRCSTSTARAMR